MTPVPDDTALEHALKNYLAIIVGYADLLLDDLPPGDPRIDDVREIQSAAKAATALLNPAAVGADD